MALTDNVVGVWEFNESSGNAADASGNGRTLTNTNTATFVSGKLSNAASLAKASDQYFRRTSDTSLKIPGDLTVSAWINPTSLGEDAYGAGVVQYCTANINEAGDYQIAVDNGGKLIFSEYPTSGSWQERKTSSAPFSTGNWYHVVCRRSSGTVTMWVNNSSQTFGTSGGTGGWDTGQFCVGSLYPFSYPSWNFDGLIDQVAVWSRAVTDQEISDLYNSGNGLAYSSWGGSPPAGSILRQMLMHH